MQSTRCFSVNEKRRKYFCFNAIEVFNSGQIFIAQKRSLLMRRLRCLLDLELFWLDGGDWKWFLKAARNAARSNRRNAQLARSASYP